MFTQPAPSPPTLATTTSPVPTASPQRPSRLRGLSYLRNYTHSHTHSHTHSRDNNDTPSGSRRYSLTRTTSYPSPNLTPTGNRQSGPASPVLQSLTQRAPFSIERSTADRGTASKQENVGATSGWLLSVVGQSSVLPVAALPGHNSDNTSQSAAMGRTRSATTGRAVGSDLSSVNGSADPQLQYNSAPAQPVNGVSGTDNVNQLPSIRFSQHQDVRAPRPSLVFSPMARTLPTGRETIRVGRYSERENQPSPASNVPSAAPVGFKSKVVSRRHCEFWYEDGQWYIKDVKSSSGTFLNHVRLSSPATESKPFPIKDGDIVQLGIDFKGGEEMIFRCVKIRIELNRGWQNALNSFNVASHKRLRNMAKQNMSPASSSSSQDCTICLGAVAPCQSLFVAPCSHTWHYKCVRRIINGPMWPQFICPNCRAVADLEADVDDPFPDAEWEEVDVGDAAEEQGSSAIPTNITSILQVPPIGTPSSPSGAASDPSRVDPQENTEENTPGSESELLQAMNHLNIALRENSATGPLESHSSIGPVNMRSGRLEVRQGNISDARPNNFNVESSVRSDRTPSPNGRLPPGLGEISGPDGPMTPRNDAGPFVFDGSGGRAADARISTLNLTTATEMPPAL